MTHAGRSVDEHVAAWSRESGAGPDFQRLRAFIDQMSEWLYKDYQPSSGGKLFWDRLSGWLNSAPNDADRKLMLQFIPWIVFVGQEEMTLLCRAIFAGPLNQWIIDTVGISIDSSSLNEQLALHRQKTWFGSFAGTDPGQFHRVNGITGQEIRPDFSQLAALGDSKAVRTHMSNYGYKYLCLYEDFVGTGSQMRQVVPLLRELSEYPTLLCPLIAAPGGCETGLELAADSSLSHVTFSPMFRTPDSACIPSIPEPAERDFLKAVRELLNRTYQLVEGSEPTQYLYGPFGCGGTGSLIVLHTNCPDNVPPLIHHNSNSWVALFPRNSRVETPQ